MASPLLHPALAHLPPSDPTPDQLAEWLTGGRDVLKDAAGPLRLWDAIQSGRSTSPQRRRLLGRLIDGARVQLGGLATWLAENLEKGLATLMGWWKKFAGVAATHQYAGVMAAMGTLDPTPADRKAADSEVRKQLGFLMRFREQLRSGAQPLFNVAVDRETGKKVVSGVFSSRSVLYAEAIHGVAEAVIREKMIREGYTEERRVLQAEARHCAACPYLAGLGWKPAGILPRIGDSPCKTRCHCSWQWRHPGSDAIVSSPLVIHP